MVNNQATCKKNYRNKTLIPLDKTKRKITFWYCLLLFFFLFYFCFVFIYIIFCTNLSLHHYIHIVLSLCTRIHGTVLVIMNSFKILFNVWCICRIVIFLLLLNLEYNWYNISFHSVVNTNFYQFPYKFIYYCQFDNIIIKSFELVVCVCICLFVRI